MQPCPPLHKPLACPHGHCSKRRKGKLLHLAVPCGINCFSSNDDKCQHSLQGSSSTATVMLATLGWTSFRPGLTKNCKNKVYKHLFCPCKPLVLHTNIQAPSSDIHIIYMMPRLLMLPAAQLCSAESSSKSTLRAPPLT